MIAIVLIQHYRMNENMEFPGATGEYIEWLQDSFVKTIREQVAASAKDPFQKKEERGKVHLNIKRSHIHQLNNF